MESVTWKLTICKLDSQREFAVWLRKLKHGLCINLEGWDGERDGREFLKLGDICISMADSCWGLTENNKIPETNYPSVHFSSVAQLCLTFCDPMDCSTPGLPVHHQLLEFTQTHAHWVGDAIEPYHPLSSPSPPAFNLSQHQGLFRWLSSLHQVAKVLEFQLQHQSFQWIFMTDFL